MKNAFHQLPDLTHSTFERLTTVVLVSYQEGVYPSRAFRAAHTFSSSFLFRRSPRAVASYHSQNTR